MTDPAPPSPATPPAPVPTGLRLLAAADDLACVDDLCLPADTPDRLGVPADASALDVEEPAR